VRKLKSQSSCSSCTNTSTRYLSLKQKIKAQKKLHDNQLSLVVFNNMAACYQMYVLLTRMWSPDKASHYLQKCLKILARELKIENFKEPEKQPSGFHLQIFDKNDSPELHSHKLQLLFVMVKIFLQNAAVKSQSMQHQEALTNANLGKFYLKTLIFNLQELIKIYKRRTRHLEKKVAYGNEDEKAYFSPFMQYPELKKYKNLNPNSHLTHDFEKFIKEVLANDPTEKDVLDKEAKNVIFWKFNPENNEKYFKKELSARSRDLGVGQKLTLMGIRDFNIGTVMHVKPMSYALLATKVDFYDYFSVKLAVEVVMTYCCSLFSIATENRYICQKRLEDQMRPSEFKGPSKKANLTHLLQRDPNFIES